MNCKEFNELRVDLARGNLLPVGLSEEALQHASQCPSCAAGLENEQVLARGIVVLRHDSSQLHPSAALESRLFQEFREQASREKGAASARVVWKNAIVHKAGGALIAAALFLLVFVLWFFKYEQAFRRSRSFDSRAGNLATKNHPVNPAKPKAKDPAIKLHIEVPPVNPTPPRVSTPAPLMMAARTAPPARGKSALRKRMTESGEEVTEFIEVTPIEDPYPPEMQQILRVRMPRINLVRFGLPVNPERLSEPIQADLLMTQDGIVKAVRFVK